VEKGFGFAEVDQTHPTTRVRRGTDQSNGRPSRRGGINISSPKLVGDHDDGADREKRNAEIDVERGSGCSRPVNTTSTWNPSYGVDLALYLF